MRDLALMLAFLLLGLAACSSLPNRKVERPVTYEMRMEDFDGELTVLDVVTIKGTVHLYLIVTEGADLYELTPPAPTIPDAPDALTPP